MGPLDSSNRQVIHCRSLEAAIETTDHMDAYTIEAYTH